MKEKENGKKKTGKKRKFVLDFVFMAAVVLIIAYMIIGQIVLPAGEERMNTAATTLDLDWVQVLADGTRRPIEVPSDVPAARGESVVIEAVLPENIVDGTWISMNSLHQEIEVYIDGELRQTFSTLKTGLFGTYSVVGYLFAQVGKEDCGRTIRLVLTTQSIYTGKISPVYYGDRVSLWNRYSNDHLLQALMAIFLFLFSIIAIMFGVAMRLSFKRGFALEYLGWAVLLTSVWMICESRMRQRFFSNLSVTADVAFLAAGLLSFPFAEYFNRVQRGRYRRCYQVIKIVSLVVFFVCTTLHVCHIVDFSDSMIFIQLMIFVMFLTVGVTMVIDFFRKNIQDYLFIAIGYIVVLYAVVEVVIGIYKAESRSKILVLAAFLLIIMALVKTGQDIVELEREKQEALATSRTKNNFLANMSHEIRTPINTIIGMNELVLRESSEQNVLEYAGNIENASKLLLTLVNDILDFSKIESGKMEVVEKVYQLASVLNDEVHLLETRAAKKNLQIMVSIDESLPSALVGDAMRIRQIITNLITNAVKYTDEGSIAFTAYGTWTDTEKFVLRVSVQDTGIGIRPEDQEKLFQRFSRFDLEKNSTIEGAGLGLAITKRLIDLMHGQIYVNSEYGKGSTFSVEIPQIVVSRGPVGDLETRYQEEVQSRKKYHEAFHAPEARVLAVDDNVMNLSVVKGLLKRTEIVVDTATSGTECLYMTRRKKYHLILMDHMMPGMDGIETFHRLREDTDNPNSNTKVIALTANAIAGSREEYLREGFVDYVTKPIDAAELEIVLMSYLPEELIITVEKEREQAQELAKKLEAAAAMNKDAGAGAANAKELTLEPESEGKEKAENESELKTEDMPQAKAEEEAAACAETEPVQEKPAKEEKAIEGGCQWIDKADGVKHCMDMEDMYMEILQDYCSEGDKYQEKLADCLAKEDWKNFAIYVHAVKSSSKTIGAEEFGEEARVLEMAAKAEEETVIRENWENFCAHFKAVLAEAEMLKS